MSTTVPFKNVKKMMKNCAEGFTMRTTDHNRRFKYNGTFYPSFPKHDDVEIGHVRSLVRALRINKQCAEDFVPI